jgi:hypothetical protein
MTILLNDVILRTGIIEHIGSRPMEFSLFSGLTFSRLIFGIILPLMILIFMSFILKRRYEAKKAKDEIILNGFYNPRD